MMALPLSGEPVSGPFLGPRLLDSALVVVRFTPVLKIGEETGTGIAAFQDAVRDEYPLVELEKEALMRIESRADGTLGAVQEEQPVWRFFDADKNWRVSLTQRSIALDVKGENYVDWPSFSERIGKLVAKVHDFFSPSLRQYIGVRYLNSAKIGGEFKPTDVCRAELMNIIGTDGLHYADLLWRLDVDEGHLTLRSGVMPSGGSYDPNIFLPRTEKTWYLDIDVGSSKDQDYNDIDINSHILAQVKRVHAIYYWAMSQGD